MKTWHEAVSEKFYITNPGPGRINVWGKTKSGKKSRSMCGWDILNNIVKITKGNCPKFKVYKDHIEI
jgi:hypothetical protein